MFAGWRICFFSIAAHSLHHFIVFHFALPLDSKYSISAHRSKICKFTSLALLFLPSFQIRCKQKMSNEKKIADHKNRTENCSHVSNENLYWILYLYKFKYFRFVHFLHLLHIFCIRLLARHSFICYICARKNLNVHRINNGLFNKQIERKKNVFFVDFDNHRYSPVCTKTVMVLFLYFLPFIYFILFFCFFSRVFDSQLKFESKKENDLGQSKQKMQLHGLKVINSLTKSKKMHKSSIYT